MATARYVKTKVYVFEVRETTSREAEVSAASLTAARRMMAEWAKNNGSADAGMGGGEPIQLSDMRTEKITVRLLDSITRYAG